MVIIMEQGADPTHVENVLGFVQREGFTPFVNPGVERKVIAVLGVIDTQKSLLADSKDLEKKVLKTIREDNNKSLQSLKSSGIQVVESPKEMVNEFEQQAIALRAKLEPSVYTHDFRMKVEKLLADYRAGKK